MSFSSEVGSSIGLVVVVFVVDVNVSVMVCERKRKGEVLLESGSDV